ncbi:conserved repeat domain-containing protein/gliding motility-associated C-terminal domain-containing protein [Pedobacter xixiisoli]|uniref:Conserved repeat domain-containing protein/gliding motility-associated C-terminal domain-containing protein n=1 Tax=Pedobacter xixiisoli TaxID=1476464 RepID=A0A285ZXM8_9SPHI|nr:gliding motility-associated C-terminal domain-containing protein [Pedobacter xixiisoli]SOD14395.1 conserved repeat domain-containing protein/gliding motility-associated C-terminal domain-containing protein [Pedobacter xixiisoli]
MILLQVNLAKAQTIPHREFAGTPVTLRLANPDANFTYQWYRDGRALPGQTSSTLIVTETGNYRVMAINQGNCASDLSDVFSVFFMDSDLEVTKKSDARAVGPNETFEYIITAINHGNTDNTAVLVEDVLPSSLRFISVNKSEEVTYINGVIKWNIPLLVVNVPQELKIQVQGKIEGLVANTAKISSTSGLLDPIPSNNQDTDEKNIIGNIKVPNVITPNGDGKNDVLKIKGIELYKENSFAIFNRWGNEVFRSSGGYQNNWNGDGLSEGTYYYVLKLVSREGISSSVTGWITLLRDK